MPAGLRKLSNLCTIREMVLDYTTRNSSSQYFVIFFFTFYSFIYLFYWWVFWGFFLRVGPPAFEKK